MLRCSYATHARVSKKRQLVSAQPVFFTCFILSRSNESVSLPPPPVRALHSGKKKRLRFSFAVAILLHRQKSISATSTSHLETIDLSAEFALSHGFFAPSRGWGQGSHRTNSRGLINRQHHCHHSHHRHHKHQSPVRSSLNYLPTRVTDFLQSCCSRC